MKTKPLNLIMGLMALIGAILIIFSQVNYGIVLLVITILIGAVTYQRKKK